MGLPTLTTHLTWLVHQGSNCQRRYNNIRIDTHRDNAIMQHNIEKHGFTYCGIIYLANGDERLAYQKFNNEP